MFKTTQDVDRYVSLILHSNSDEKERSSRGYRFAKLYYKVADYESGKRYLQMFLQETVPQAHKLMGQIYEALKDRNNAIEAYKRSLDIDPNQNDLDLKVSELSELYIEPSVAVNADNAKAKVLESGLISTSVTLASASVPCSLLTCTTPAQCGTANHTSGLLAQSASTRSDIFVFQGQCKFDVMPKTTSIRRKFGLPNKSGVGKPTTPMMPLNHATSQSTVKPSLTLGSVGVTSKHDETVQLQSAQEGRLSAPDTSTFDSTLSQITQGLKALLISEPDEKQQDDKQRSESAPAASHSTHQKIVIQGVSFTSILNVSENEVDDTANNNSQTTTSGMKLFSGVSIKSDMTDSIQADVNNKKVTDVEKSDSEAGKGDLTSLFEMKPGPWTCDGCYIQNDADILKCPCCNTLKSGVKPEDVKTSTPAACSSSNGSGFEFGTQLSDQSRSQSGSEFSVGKEDLSSLFKQKPGAWTCDGCYIQNDADILKCPCCNTLKSGVKPEDVKTSTPAACSSSNGSGFEFGTQLSDQSRSQSGSEFSVGKEDLSSLFKQKPGAWTCDGCYIQNNADILKCPCCNTLKSGVKPEDVKTSTPAACSSSNGSGFEFGTQLSDQSRSQSGSEFSVGKEDLSSLFKQKPGAWTCDGCYIQNDADILKCPCCNTLKSVVKPEDVKTSTPAAFSSSNGSGFEFGTQLSDQSRSQSGSEFSVGKEDLSSLFKQKPGAWTCDGCYIQNDADILKCPCCNTLKSGVKPEDVKTSTPAACSSSNGSGFEFGTQLIDQSRSQSGSEFSVGKEDLASLFKQKPGAWTCDGCYIQNDVDILKCPCCNTLKSGVKPEDVKTSTPAACSSSNGSGFEFGTQLSDQSRSQSGSEFSVGKEDLSSLFKQKPGAWTCDGCYIQNDADILKCPCCNTLKSGVKPEDVKTSTPAAGSSSNGSGFEFGTQLSDQSRSQSGSEFSVGKEDLSSLFKQKPGAWTCDGCYIQNDADILKCPCCHSFKSGVKPEDVKIDTPAAFSGSSGSGFKFGTQPSDQCRSQSGSDFKAETQPTYSGSGATCGSGFKWVSPTKTGPLSGTGFKLETPTTIETSHIRFLFGSKPADSTKTSSTPSSSIFGFKFTTAAITATSPKNSRNTFVSGSTNTVTISRPVTTKTSGTVSDFTEICKSSYGFPFGGASGQTPDSINAASSSGLNVNKETLKYPFGSPSKSAVDSDSLKSSGSDYDKEDDEENGEVKDDDENDKKDKDDEYDEEDDGENDVEDVDSDESDGE